jgi:AcrR family transcriptional regulator
MPYPVGHRAEVKGKIIQSARRLFNRHGFDNVSIQQIMSGAGLTHGGFYSYFHSKNDLYTHVLGCSSTSHQVWRHPGKRSAGNRGSSNAAAQVVRAYLSRQHFEDIENSCPMLTLPTDVMRGDRNVRRAFETVFTTMVGDLERSGPADNRQRHAKAQAVAALCVGGMVVARAMANRVVADELRDACMSIALELGGWMDTSALKEGAQEQLVEECLSSLGELLEGSPPLEQAVTI